jgi:hypothetical protein
MILAYIKVKCKVKLSRYRHVGAKRERRYSSYSFMTSALEGGEWPVSRPGRGLPPGMDSVTHWTGVCVGLRAGLDTEARGKIIFPCRGSNPGRSVCSEALITFLNVSEE